MDDNNLTITVRIAERDYKLTIVRKEEEIVRNSVKLIDKRISEYANNYAFKDMQDLLSMTALHYTIQTLQMEEKQEYIDHDIIPKLAELNLLLENKDN